MRNTFLGFMLFEAATAQFGEGNAFRGVLKDVFGGSKEETGVKRKNFIT